MNLPDGAYADPDHPGWYCWGLPRDGRFHNILGPILLRGEGPGRARCRIIPSESLLNYGGSLHGGAVMTFIDMALFGGGRCAGLAEGHYVTLDCSAHFIARGRAGIALDALVILVRQTPGHAFFIGTCEQDGEATHSWSGTLKRIRQ